MLLERKYQEKWGKREKADLTHSGSIDTKVDELQEMLKEALGEDGEKQAAIARALYAYGRRKKATQEE